MKCYVNVCDYDSLSQAAAAAEGGVLFFPPGKIIAQIGSVNLGPNIHIIFSNNSGINVKNGTVTLDCSIQASRSQIFWGQGFAAGMNHRINEVIIDWFGAQHEPFESSDPNRLDKVKNASKNAKAIQRAIIFSASAGYPRIPIVRIPIGEYYVNESISVPNNIHLVGHGRFSILSCAKPNKKTSYKTLLNVEATGNVLLDNFSIFGNNQILDKEITITGVYLKLLENKKCTYSRFSNLNIKEMTHHGIHVEADRGAAAGLENSVITNCIVRDSRTHNIFLEQSYRVEIQSCRIRTSKNGNGILLDECRDVMINNCRIDNNEKGAGILNWCGHSPNVSNLSVVNCHFIENDWGIRLQGTIACLINGNAISRSEKGAIQFNPEGFFGTDKQTKMCLVTSNIITGISKPYDNPTNISDLPQSIVRDNIIN